MARKSLRQRIRSAIRAVQSMELPRAMTTKNGNKFQLEKRSSRSLRCEEETWVKSLLKRNMEAHFTPEKWPQVLPDKLAEAVEPDAIYLIIRDATVVIKNATDRAEAMDAATMSLCTAEAGAVSGAPGRQDLTCQVPEGTTCEPLSGEQLSSNSRTENSDKVHCRLKSTDRLVAFMHFRIVEEDDLASFYVYELQVEAEYQGMGIGSKLMKVASVMANKCGLDAIFLTVQKNNKVARNFYIDKLRFETANHSPTENENPDYEILVKKVA